MPVSRGGSSCREDGEAVLVVQVDGHRLFDFGNVPHIKESIRGKGGQDAGDNDHIENKEMEQQPTRCLGEQHVGLDAMVPRLNVDTFFVFRFWPPCGKDKKVGVQ